MLGEVMRVRLDRSREYLPLRKRKFGFELAPLPKSLRLPVAESQPDHALTH
jgi:hypothetical protein